jgi:hypothetical protein
MTDKGPEFEPLNVEDADALRAHYAAIKQWLLAQTERDIRHHLPNIVETLAAASEESDTVRFVGGVSFTQNHTPLDYQLDRIYVDDDVDFYRREAMKLPVSKVHHYVRFVYPPDPAFDAAALRTVLLASMEGAIHAIENGDDPRPATRLANLWKDL